MSENYNKYNETLDINCCNKKTTAKNVKYSNCCCGGESLPSHDNEIEVLIAQLKREVKKLMKTTEARLLCQNKKIDETMVYIKNNLSNAIRNLLNSMDMDEIITSVINESIEILNSKTSEIFNVSQFGVMGDGTTNNLSALNTALGTNGNKNKIIRFEEKTYGVTGKLYLYSNTTLELNNATIKNIGDSDSRLMLMNNIPSVKVPGYGALKNIIIRNGTFEGCNSGVVFALLHAENVEINNVTFLNCCVSNHIFDLGGCKNVKFINCKFIGCTLAPEYNFREIIQTDYARYEGQPFWGNDSSFAFDELPTRDLIIDGCIFEKGEGNAYPNAIGTHSIGDDPIENIIIRNCKFYDNSLASIRLPRVKDLLIENNEFYNINTDSSRGNTYFINLACMDYGSFSNNPSKNVQIYNNKFLVDGGIGNGTGITFRGYDSNQMVQNLVVRDNYFESTYTESTNGADAIHTGNAVNVTFDNNTCYKIKNSFLQITNSILHDIKFINNTMEYCRDSIRGSSVNELNLGMSNNIWIDDTGMINLNDFITTVTLSNDVTVSEVTTANIPYNVCDNPFFTINSNNSISIPKQFKRIKVTAYTMLNISGDDPDPILKTCVLNVENLSTNETISNSSTGVFDRGYNRSFPEVTNGTYDVSLDDRIIRVSHRFTQGPSETLIASGTKLIIQGY